MSYLLQRLPVLGKVFRCLWRSHRDNLGVACRFLAYFSRCIWPESFLLLFLLRELPDEPWLSRGVARGALGGRRLHHPGPVQGPQGLTAERGVHAEAGGDRSPLPSPSQVPAPIRGASPPAPGCDSRARARAGPRLTSGRKNCLPDRESHAGSDPAPVSTRASPPPEVLVSSGPAGNAAFASSSAPPGARPGSSPARGKGRRPSARRPGSATQGCVG